MKSTKFLFVLFAAMFVVILVSSKHLSGMRLDLSENGLYTLSEGTKKILSNLEEEISIQLYFSEKATTQLPALRSYAQRIEELLGEYAGHSNGRLAFEKIDPEPFSEAEDEANAAGLQGVPAGMNGDQIYFGLVARDQSGSEEVIPFLQPDREAFLEYELTQMVSALAKKSLPKVGIYSNIEINGGYDYMRRQPRQAWTIVQYIENTFEVEWLDADAESLDDIDVLLLIAPQNLTDTFKLAIDQFVLKGGRALVFLDPFSEVQATSTGMPSIQRSDMADMLPSWGLKLREDEFVKDYVHSMAINTGLSPRPVRHLGLLSTTADAFDNDDIVFFGLESITWTTAGILEKLEGASTTITPLVQTSNQSQPHLVEELLEMQDPAVLLDGFAPTGEQYMLAARVTGAASTAFPEGITVTEEAESPADGDLEEGAEESTAVSTTIMPEIKSAENIQVMVFSDSDVLSDRVWVQVQNFFGQQIVSPWADNGSMLVNALEQMSGDPSLIEIRSQGRFSRPFDRVEDLRLAAEERFLEEQEILEAQLGALEEKLVQLEQARDGTTDSALFTPEQEQELLNFQDEKLKIRKKLREVQHQLDRDIEQLGTNLKLINILLVPGLILAFLLLNGARRKLS